MSRRPYIPYAPYAAAFGEVLRPRDPRGPAVKSRCKREVETLLAAWAPRGRTAEVAWHMLRELALKNGRRLAAWNGAQISTRVVAELGVRLRREGGTAFQAPGSAEAPPAAIGQCDRLFDGISVSWVCGRVAPGRLAWALLVATLEEAWVRFGPQAAAELAELALGEILPPTGGPPRAVQEARP